MAILLVGIIMMQVIRQRMPIQLLQPLLIHLQSQIYQLILFRIFIIIWMYQMPMVVKRQLMVAYQDLQVLTDKQR